MIPYRFDDHDLVSIALDPRSAYRLFFAEAVGRCTHAARVLLVPTAQNNTRDGITN